MVRDFSSGLQGRYRVRWYGINGSVNVDLFSRVSASASIMHPSTSPYEP